MPQSAIASVRAGAVLFTTVLAALASPALAQTQHAQTQSPFGRPSMAPPSMAPGESASVLRPKGMKLFPDTPQGVKGTALPGNEFVETQQRLLFLVEFDPASAGTKIDVAIMSVRTAAGLEQAIFTSGDKIGPDGRLPIELKLPRHWPVGQYDVRLGASERLIASLPFKVVPTAPRNTPIKAATAIGIVVTDTAGKPAIVATPKPSNRQLNFVIDTSGSNTAGASVSWTLTALETSNGNNVLVGENTVANWPLENTRLPFDVELPRDWPTGKYRIEVKIDGQLLNALQFEIKP